MLRHSRLAAVSGLPTLKAASQGAAPGDEVASSPSADNAPVTGDVEYEVVEVKILKKRFAEQEYQEYIFFDLEFSATGLDKPARAIKGTLNLADLFGEVKMRVSWSVDDPLQPGGTVTERGTGFKYNQFMDDHRWVRATSQNDMTATCRVESILYQDGTRRDF